MTHGEVTRPVRNDLPGAVLLGDRTVRLPVGGPMETPFAYLLGGLPASDNAPDLSITSRWVDAVRAPDVPPLRPEQEIFADDARGRLDERGAWLASPTLFAALSSDWTSLSFDAIQEERRPNYDAAFLLFSIAMHAQGWTHVHAGAVELPDGRCAVLAGGTGDGKSTSVLSLALHGCRWGSDDCCYFRATDAGVEGAFAPRVFQLRPRTVEAFPHLEPLLFDVQWRHGVRRALDPMTLPGAGAPMLTSPRVDVVVFPRVTRQPVTVVRPLDPVAAMMRLLPNSPYASIDGLPDPARALDLPSRLVSTAECVELGLGWDALEAPEVVLNALQAAL